MLLVPCYYVSLVFVIVMLFCSLSCCMCLLFSVRRSMFFVCCYLFGVCWYVFLFICCVPFCMFVLFVFFGMGPCVWCTVLFVVCYLLCEYLFVLA